MMAPSKVLRPVATGSPFLCLGLSAGLAWAVATVRDDWDVWTMVALFYGALVSAVVAHVAAFLLTRAGQEPPPAVAGTVRSVLSVWVALTALWVWCGPWLQPIVGWGVRQVSVWRFGW
jgi:hypothetical protein